MLAGWQLRILQRLKPRCRSFVDQIAAIAGAEVSEASLLTVNDDELPGVTLSAKPFIYSNKSNNNSNNNSNDNNDNNNTNNNDNSNNEQNYKNVIGLLYMAYPDGRRHILHSCRG